MTKEELIDFGFELENITVEDSGNKNPYYYYSFKVIDNMILLSTDSDLVKDNEWNVYCYNNELIIDSMEDLELFVSLVRRFNKNFK